MGSYILVYLPFPGAPSWRQQQQLQLKKKKKKKKNGIVWAIGSRHRMPSSELHAIVFII